MVNQATASLLTDSQVQTFIREGWLRLQADVEPSVHALIDERLRFATEREFMMGNNIVARIPAIWQVLRSPAIHGAVQSLLGPNYYVHPHRAIHTSTPVTDATADVDVAADAPTMGVGSMAGSGWHQDAQSPLSRARHHLPRYLIGFYYPHDVPLAMGPTRWQSGSHLHANPTTPANIVQPDDVTAGTFVLLHFDMVHAGFPNRMDQTRYMLKFVFTRTERPSGPTWNHDPAFAMDAPAGTAECHLWNWLSGDSAAASGQASEELPPVEDLDSEDPARRLAAIYALGARGDVDVLAARLRDRAGLGLEQRVLATDRDGRTTPRDDIRGYPRRWNERAIVMEGATYALAAAGSRAMDVLNELLRSEDPWVLLNAAFAVGEIGAAAGSAVPRLAELLAYGEQAVVRQALDALGLLGLPLGPALPAIAELLERSPPSWNQPAVRRGWTARDQIALNAAFALLNAVHVDGEDLVQVERLLVRLLDDSNGYVGAVASEALTRLETPSAARAALRYLQERRWDDSLAGNRVY